MKFIVSVTFCFTPPFGFTYFAFHTHNESNTAFQCFQNAAIKKESFSNLLLFINLYFLPFPQTFPILFLCLAFSVQCHFFLRAQWTRFFSWQPNESLILVAFYCYIFLHNIPFPLPAACSASNAAHFTLTYWLQNDKKQNTFKSACLSLFITFLINTMILSSFCHDKDGHHNAMTH